MTEHPTKKELDEYCQRVLAPAAFLSVHRHVSACPRCAAQCNSPEHLTRDLGQLREALISSPDDTPYHLSPTEMVAYMESTLNEIDLEIAESHLGNCAICLSEVERRKAEGQHVTPAHISAAASKPRRWLIWPFTNGWQPIRVAIALLFGAAVILFTLWLLRSKPAEHTETVGPVNMSSPQSSSTANTQGSNTPEPPPNEFALVLNDGGRKVTLDKRGTLAGLELLPVRIQEKVGAALKAGKVEQPATLAQLASQPSTLLGDSGNGLPFRLIAPLGQIVRSQQPTFRWRSLPGAQSYKVIITDADLNEVAASLPLNRNEWRIIKPLQRGGTYSWQVTAMKDGVAITSPVLPAPQAKFKVIDLSTARTLQQAERVYRDSHLILGVLYAEAGLLEEAEQELGVLVRENPRVDVAQKLLQSVQAMRAARNSSAGRS